MKRILFQGDSITDCGRSRDNFDAVGTGYPLLVKAFLGKDHPLEFDFQNRGVSGNRVVDVYARIKADIINLKPDYMSILIGVNDIWHELSNRNGVAPDKFEKIYSMLIEEIKEALPDTKIMILEPFCLKGTATDDCEAIPDKWSKFRGGTEQRAERAKKVAERYGLKFIPLQQLFDEAAQNTPTSYWLVDGVHPTAMGHELIKREWLKAFKSISGDM